MAHTQPRGASFAAEIEDVAGKGIVITGGTTGIGRAAALLLASHGARVLIFGRHQYALDDAMNNLRELSDDVFGVTADVTRPDDIQRVFAEAERHLGQLDVFVNNAALAADDVASTPYDEIEYIIKTNLLGYMTCAHEAVERMKKQGHGHIVNVGSMSADVREEGSSVYVASKAGIQGFSEALRKEVNKYGIKVTLIEPGAVGTDMQPESPREQRAKQEKLEMLKAEDIAACIHYCLVQPKRCDVVVVQIRPHMQPI
jgi:NAD(P)-dependent dehydrogenase (short-subunit alcohol dehydrogenase family)